MRNQDFPVKLSERERRELESIIRAGQQKALLDAIPKRPAGSD